MSDEQAAALADGRRVVLHGLASRPDLNHRRGAVVGYDGAAQRYAVRVKPTGKHPEAASVRVKAANLHAMPLAVREVAPVKPYGWVKDFRADAAYEWLCDCYRLRCDDDYAYGGCYLHGPYDPGTTAEMLLLDFAVFVKLAVARGAIPAPGKLPWDWSWGDFLAKASRHIRFAFEKSDADEKYGSENIFSGAMGGRSLRFTAELVIGSPSMCGSAKDPLAESLLARINSGAREAIKFALGAAEDETLAASALPVSARTFFDDVGGAPHWRELLVALCDKLPKENPGGDEDYDDDSGDDYDDDEH